MVRRVAVIPPDQRFITAITVRERLDGWYALLGRAKTPEEEARAYRRLTDTIQVCATIRILPYDVEAIARFKQMQSAKLNVAGMDLRIAAIVLQHDAILVTRNTRDFARVPGLILENWADES